MTEKERLEIIGDISVERTEQIIAAVQTVHATMPYPFLLNTELECVKYEDTATFRLYRKGDNKKIISSFSLSSFPGCNTVAISHNVYVYDDFKGKGYGAELLKLRLRALSLAGFQRVLATVRQDNLIEEHILEGNSWKPLFSFDSEHQGRVVMWERVL